MSDARANVLPCIRWACLLACVQLCLWNNMRVNTSKTTRRPHQSATAPIVDNSTRAHKHKDTRTHHFECKHEMHPTDKATETFRVPARKLVNRNDSRWDNLLLFCQGLTCPICTSPHEVHPMTGRMGGISPEHLIKINGEVKWRSQYDRSMNRAFDIARDITN